MLHVVEIKLFAACHALCSTLKKEENRLKSAEINASREIPGIFPKLSRFIAAPQRLTFRRNVTLLPGVSQVFAFFACNTFLSVVAWCCASTTLPARPSRSINFRENPMSENQILRQHAASAIWWLFQDAVSAFRFKSEYLDKVRVSRKNSNAKTYLARCAYDPKTGDSELNLNPYGLIDFIEDAMKPFERGELTIDRPYLYWNLTTHIVAHEMCHAIIDRKYVRNGKLTVPQHGMEWKTEMSNVFGIPFQSCGAILAKSDVVDTMSPELIPEWKDKFWQFDAWCKGAKYQSSL